MFESRYGVGIDISVSWTAVVIPDYGKRADTLQNTTLLDHPYFIMPWRYKTCVPYEYWTLTPQLQRCVTSYLGPYLLALSLPYAPTPHVRRARIASQHITNHPHPLKPISRARQKSLLQRSAVTAGYATSMDDHHDQPVWPMVQGAANYAWNLIEEAVAMVWNPVHEP
jgi:hypothetical protein